MALIGALAGAFLVAPVSAGRAVAAPGGCAAGQPAEAAEEAAATALAKACARRVEVTGARSERVRVYAEPSGTLTWEASAVPERVRRADGSWTEIDRTLRTGPDGSIAPAATAADVRFSRGGTEPLITWRRDGRQFTLSWPTALPAPTLAGASATYAGVFPGADLRVTATAEGFRHVLVVSSATAAANPALRTIQYRYGGDVSVVTTPEGGLRLLAGGEEFAAADGAVMWDSSVTGVRTPETAPTAEAPGGAGRARPVGLSVVDSIVVLTPDPAALADPRTEYPLYIDPSFSGAGAQSWEKRAYSNDDNTNWPVVDPVSGEAQFWIGHDPVNFRIYRSFFQFPLTYGSATIRGKTILSARIDTEVDHTHSCDAQEVYLYKSNGISVSSGTRATWSSMPLGTQLAKATPAPSNETGGCGADQGDHTFSFTGLLAADLQTVVGGTATTYSVAVSAADTSNGSSESSQPRWKRFNLGGTNGGFKLIVGYNTKPTLGAVSMVPNLPCGSYLNTGSPAFRAVVNDADGGTLAAAFQWQRHNGTSWVAAGSTTQSTIPTGSAGQVTMTPAGVDGGTYRWQAEARDGVDESGWSDWCPFYVDTTDPNQPAVSSTEYPEECVCGSTTRAGNFTLTSSSDVVAFRWGTTDPPSNEVPVALGAPLTFAHTPAQAGPYTLYVQAKDRAGNLSTVRRHSFFVPGPAPNVGRWLQHDPFTDPLVDSSGAPTTHDLTPVGSISTTAPGRIPSEYATNVTNTANGNYASTGHVLATTSSYSVSAWVRLTDASRSRTIVSQTGTRSSAFFLQYRAASNQWSMLLTGADADEPTTYSARSTASVQLGQWTHLVGVYNAGAKEVRLYVNGVPEAVGAAPTAWDQPTGPLLVGAAKWNGATADGWHGDLSDVRVWSRVLGSQEVAAMQAPTLTGQWRLNGSPADASLYGRNLVLTGGASLPATGAGVDGSGMLLDGVDDTAATTGGAPVVRTDESFTVSAWVRLADADPSDPDFDPPTRPHTAVSQDGTKLSGFYLGYRYTGSDSSPRWSFSMTGVDAESSNGWANALSAALVPAAIGTWTRLTGAYDARTGAMTLYVNGAVAGTAVRPGRWHAGGALRVGGAVWTPVGGSSSVTDYFAGSIDEVRVWAGVIPVIKGEWAFESCTGSPTSCVDSAVPGSPMTLVGSGATWVTSGKYRSGLRLVSDGSANTAGPVVDTTRSFTVGAWVRLTDKSAHRAALSQGGANQSMFQLGYRSDVDAWCLSVKAADQNAAPRAESCSAAADVVLNEWIHLAGVFDATAGTVRLYVNGSGKSTAAFTTPWNATSPLAIGRARALDTGAVGSYWRGDLDEVRVYPSAFSNAAVLSSMMLS